MTMYQAPQPQWQGRNGSTVTHHYKIQYDAQERCNACFYANRITGESDVKYAANGETIDDLKAWVKQTHYPSALRKAGFKPVNEPISDTLKWFEMAVPKPTAKNLATQIGCHLEEVVEMLESLGDIQESQWLEALADFYKQSISNTELMADREKDNEFEKELLDSLCDQIVTALGVGYMFGFDMRSALAEVVRSNWSKFENGKPVFDENGKIKKGVNYAPPRLGEFI